MCKYMSFKNEIPMCINGQMCTLCVIGNSNTYKELESNGENNYEVAEQLKEREEIRHE